MAYDELLSKRISELLKGKNGFVQKKMFGGIGYLFNGNMCVGVYNNDLIIRFDPKSTDEIQKDKNVKPFDISGRPMKGWALVSIEGVKGDGLKKWIELSLNFARSLPPKK